MLLQVTLIGRNTSKLRVNRNGAQMWVNMNKSNISKVTYLARSVKMPLKCQFELPAAGDGGKNSITAFPFLKYLPIRLQHSGIEYAEARQFFHNEDGALLVKSVKINSSSRWRKNVSACSMCSRLLYMYLQYVRIDQISSLFLARRDACASHLDKNKKSKRHRNLNSAPSE